MAKEGKYTTIHYHDYLQLDSILGAQKLRSSENEEPAHEEMLFIVTHQVYELWFKQLIHEIESVTEMFASKKVDERQIGVAVARLNRTETILKLLIDQIGVMETMTPLDFLDFRSYLFPASGFQSFQFRCIESILGLPESQRMTYHGQKFSSVFPEEQQAALDAIYSRGTLFELVEDWLERTPFLKTGNFNFLDKYVSALDSMLNNEQAAIQASEYLSEREKSMRTEMVGSSNTYFKSILKKDVHEQMIKDGSKRMSYDATLAALFINLYRDEPILHMPYNLLNSLVEIDDLLTTWRYRHAQMVLRMLGNKIGTGGSSGHDYLNKTAQKHKIFTDFHHISSLLIPRSELPELPKEIKQKLSFYYTNN